MRILYATISYKQIKIREFYKVNQKSIIDFMKRYNKKEVTLHCRKCDSDFACQQNTS